MTPITPEMLRKIVRQLGGSNSLAKDVEWVADFMRAGVDVDEAIRLVLEENGKED